MARSRTIKSSFWTSEQIMMLPLEARLLFIGMWNFCDDNGIYPASLIKLKAEIFPSDIFNLEDINCWVGELESQKLIHEYQIGENKYWIVTGWSKHQKVDKPTFLYPLPTSQVTVVVND